MLFSAVIYKFIKQVGEPMDTQGDDPTKVVVRRPADVRREQAASQPDYRAEIQQRLDDAARIIAAELSRRGERNQRVHDDNEFSARVNLNPYRGLPTQPLKNMVEGLVQELLGDVELLVKIYDDRTSYDGAEEDYDITIWATPRS
jgi:hypothetical protein